MFMQHKKIMVSYFNNDLFYILNQVGSAFVDQATSPFGHIQL